MTSNSLPTSTGPPPHVSSLTRTSSTNLSKPWAKLYAGWFTLRSLLRAQTHTHTLSLSLSDTHAHTHWQKHVRALTRTHTHTHTHSQGARKPGVKQQAQWFNFLFCTCNLSLALFRHWRCPGSLCLQKVPSLSRSLFNKKHTLSFSLSLSLTHTGGHWRSSLIFLLGFPINNIQWSLTEAREALSWWKLCVDTWQRNARPRIVKRSVS